ncbi:amino acid deaminase [Vibrio nigripulchritudo]|uniref:amino acid deaminase n=1 Tax=Vibrio nigripulchritudo TaxID=28173 RepID=UPI0005FA3E5F|nr:amino acid deaminase [Vibrio nigripulchritudo]KJY75663.1 amino acid deaminase [Vibrio nigripulchritudo]
MKSVTNYQDILDNVGTKGVWVQSNESGKYSLIDEEIMLPAAVIKHSAVRNNLQWMQSFADQHLVKLAPHGKTTMSPALFKKQLEAGAWGITVANIQQAWVAFEAGAKRILLANQLVGKANMARASQLLENPDIELYCCVDSQDNIEQLSQYFNGRQQEINLLIEYGMAGGRCGVRHPETMQQLAGLIHELPGVELHGVEFYEGAIHHCEDSERRIRYFIGSAVELALSFKQQGLIKRQCPILTGAGSAWYDVVSECFMHQSYLTTVIRPGCYLIHDTGIYQDAQQKVIDRSARDNSVACHMGSDLTSSLEMWAYVISTPEPGKAIVGLGKRDVAFDAGLPTPVRRYRKGELLDITGLKATDIMDQHTYVSTPEDSNLKVGDIVVFSTSHPCLTFDKWRYVCVCDDDYQVTHLVETQF